ncbi:MAG: hypothetical protein AAB373_04705 [Patescibacteria group bacterium]
MKKVLVLGSTGSLGKQTLQLLNKYRKEFEVIGLCANQNGDLLNDQLREFPNASVLLISRDGKKALNNFVESGPADLVINVLAGTIATDATIKALKKGKQVLLANKEAIICRGQNLTQLNQDLIKETGVDHLIPLDSEHNAIYEILRHASSISKNPQTLKVKNIYLPCSGGPLLGKTKKDLKNLTLSQILKHPKWSMGAKISLESALLINKGLEIIEAHYLFNLPLNKIKTFLHPECQIHGIVEFTNGQIYSYKSQPDMAEHIENALLRSINGQPNLKSKIKKITPAQFKKLTSKKVSQALFPGINLILNLFKTSPKSLKPFLQKEEKLIAKLLTGKITLQEFLKNLLA